MAKNSTKTIGPANLEPGYYVTGGMPNRAKAKSLYCNNIVALNRLREVEKSDPPGNFGEADIKSAWG
jgi:hypothetical protein